MGTTSTANVELLYVYIDDAVAKRGPFIAVIEGPYVPVPTLKVESF